jgi:hypothetical protein
MSATVLERRAAWPLGLIYVREGAGQQAAAYLQIAVDFEQSIGHPDAEQHAAYLEEAQRRIQQEHDEIPHSH